MSLTLAVIGGSGFYTIPGLTRLETLDLETPYGSPSSALVCGQLGSTRLLFLSRHGNHHQIAPHSINFQANVCALKMAGATHVVSLSAVGSMREAVRPGDVVIVNDFIDLTRKRVSTFFDDGIVAHVSMATPTCPLLSEALFESAQIAGARVHRPGTYLCIEGPQFSTRAESHLYRSWGVEVIGMTAMPEAKLAREAELPYATAAFVTDYDCWNESEAAVTAEQVIATSKENAQLAPRIVSELAARLPNPQASPAYGALSNAVLTPSDHRSPQAQEKLRWLMGNPKER
jgi:5'-methylthioadenosine phosphorylase